MSGKENIFLSLYFFSIIFVLIKNHLKLFGIGKKILNQRMVVSMNMKICQEKSGVSKQDQNQQNVWILVIE